MLRKPGFIILEHEEISKSLIYITFNPRTTIHPVNLFSLYYAGF